MIEQQVPKFAGALAVKKLLAFVTSVNVPVLPAFTAADHFKKDTKGAVRIWSLGNRFKAEFLRRIEYTTAATDIKVHKLLEKFYNSAIMTELGDACGITLGQFFYLLSKQGQGEAGPLLVNGWENVAYIQDMDTDTDDIFWTVNAYWYAVRGGWHVEVYLLSDSRRCRAGNQFLSR